MDTGTSASVAGVINALREKNFGPTDVAYVFLTHIHLDHAGGAGGISTISFRTPDWWCIPERAAYGRSRPAHRQRNDGL